MKRRRVLLGLAGLAVVVWLGKPRDHGAPYDDYFRALNEELRRNGPSRPCLVMDLDRLDHNIAVLRRSIRPPKYYRVVAKSLPSVPLIKYIFDKAQTNRLMAFHQPFLNVEAEAIPDADILLGKPLPVRSAELFYRDLRGPFDPSRQLQWLIDTPAHLAEYLDLANRLGQKLQVNIEIDVGLHRGGVRDHATLGEMLRMIAAHPERLEFAGFMGYDAHVARVPRLFGSREGLLRKVLESYAGFVGYAREEFPHLWRDDLTLNGAGSTTYRLYENDTLVNDLSVGSALMKPSDFDLDTLAEHVPALFIATPVLKASPGLRLPAVEWLGPLLAWWDPNQRQTFFIYGGNWMAKPVAPAGLRNIYGRSSNQEMLNGSLAVGIGVEDNIFLRPTQSEAVMLQFGDLVVVRGRKIVDRWPVFDAR